MVRWREEALKNPNGRSIFHALRGRLLDQPVAIRVPVSRKPVGRLTRE